MPMVVTAGAAAGVASPVCAATRLGQRVSLSKPFAALGATFSPARLDVPRGRAMRCLAVANRAGQRPPLEASRSPSVVQTPEMNEKRKALAGALQLELAAQRDQLEGRLKNWPLQRLVREGVTLVNLSAKKDGMMFRDTVVRFELERGQSAPSQSFSNGDVAVVVPHPTGAIPGMHLEGIVVSKSPAHIKVAMPGETAERVLAMMTRWRLDQGVNTTVFQRGMSAVEALTAPIPLKLPPTEAIRKIALCDKFSARLAASNWAKVQWRERAFSELAMVGSDINDSQHAAISTALCRRLTLWQGPPGTGKTRTLLRFIDVCRRSGLQGSILACADSNIAADNLLEGLLGLGVKVVRIGQPVKVQEALRAATVEGQVAEHPWGRQAIERREAALRLKDDAKEQERKGNVGVAIKQRQEASTLLKEAREYEDAAKSDVLGSAEVLVGTCVGVGDRVLEGRSFSVVVVDEATQATEPACLIPMMKGAMCVVMAGDPMQLPPTVVSRAALDLGLGMSLFERLTTDGEVEAVLLDTQYRMHPAIAEFSSSAFYGGRVRSAPTAQERPSPLGFPWPVADTPVCFVQCRGLEEGKEGGRNMDSSGSVGNRGEAEMAVELVQKMLEAGDVGARGLVVLTPYQRQLRILSAELRRAGIQGVEVRTVDGYQGRESDVVVFSAVRSNERQSLGFVSDVRRLNVAFTRARRGLVVLGNPDTLASSDAWVNWMRWMSERGCSMDEEDLREQLAFIMGKQEMGAAQHRREKLWADDTEINGPTDHNAMASGGEKTNALMGGKRGSGIPTVPSARPSPEEKRLRQLTLKDLKVAAREFKVKGYSRMKKSELVAALHFAGFKVREAAPVADGDSEADAGGASVGGRGEHV